MLSIKTCITLSCNTSYYTIVWSLSHKQGSMMSPTLKSQQAGLKITKLRKVDLRSFEIPDCEE